MSRGIEEFLKAKKKFEEKLSHSELQIVVELRDDLNRLGAGPNDQGFVKWQGNYLTQFEMIIARKSELIGEYYANADTRAAYLKAWIDERKAKRFQILKRELASAWPEEKRITDTMVEREMDNELAEETEEMQMWSGHAKMYKSMLEAIDRVLLATTHRIHELERQMGTARKTG